MLGDWLVLIYLYLLYYCLGYLNKQLLLFNNTMLQH